MPLQAKVRTPANMRPICSRLAARQLDSSRVPPEQDSLYKFRDRWIPVALPRPNQGLEIADSEESILQRLAHSLDHGSFVSCVNSVAVLHRSLVGPLATRSQHPPP